MKKIFMTVCLSLPLLFTASACKKSVDYSEYVSEYRKSVYFYEDDNITVKIYCSEKETPQALDGVKGAVSELCEVYYSSEKDVEEVEIALLGKSGEMSYLSVTQNFYLSFSGGASGEASIPVTVTADGKEQKIDVFNVAEEGTIDGKTALKCVYEYDKESFTSLTQNNVFAGEIIVKLLYDEGCFYYVGICDRESHVHAYLVDGTDGRIIAERETEAE